MTMNKQGLKPCPFCGCEAVSIQSKADHPEYGSGGRYYYVKCISCRAQSGSKYAHEVCPIFYSEVRQEWNNRAVPVDLAALVPDVVDYTEAYKRVINPKNAEWFAQGANWMRAEMLRRIENSTKS